MTPAAEITREEELYWLALRLVPGLGPRKTFQLIEQFGSPRAVFRCSLSELEAAGAGGSTARSVASGCTFDEAATQHQTMIATGTVLISLQDPRYPERLRKIFDPPPVLFARGRIELLETVMLAVVGTRRPTPYGVAAAERLSKDLAHAGLTITSGLAKGIDTAAHRATLSVGGNTVTVLGCGADQMYPAENRKLAEEIVAKGLLLSEFPMGTPAYPQNFPIRNRVVSGLSAGVMVVEGAKYSGSSITARLAIEQNRELFAVPGNITSKMSWGPNLLIKQGAKLVQEAEDVLAELTPADRRRLYREAPPSPSAQPSQTALDLGLHPLAEQELLARLQPDQATHIDLLLQDLPQYSSSELFAALFELEMLGKVRQLAGKNFIKVW